MELNKEYDCELINSGTYGRIYEIKDLNDLVIKVMKVSKISLVEIDIMCRLKHPNIVGCIDFGLCEIKENKIKKVTYETEYYGIIMKKAIGDLSQFNFCKETLLDIIEQIKYGLAFLHNNNIIHLDIKSSNILLYKDDDTRKPIAKITDFGLSVYTNDYYHMPSFANTTIHCRAPELNKDVEFNKNVDFWSLGCIIFQKITGIKTFTEKYENIFHSMTQEQINELIDKEFKDSVDKSLTEFTKKCLILDSKLRKVILFDKYPYNPSYVTFEEPTSEFLIKLYFKLIEKNDKDFIHILLKFILINNDIENYDEYLLIIYNYIHHNDKKYNTFKLNIENCFQILTNCEGKINNKDTCLKFNETSMNLLNKLEIDLL